jgi:hypothetical protein
MAYYAFIENGTVTSVHVISDAEAPDETTGAEFLHNLYELGEVTDWVQTFIDGERGKQAVVGDSWNGSEFVAPAAPEVETPITP